MCRHYGIDYHIYSNRKRAGWSIEKILTTPTLNNGYACTDYLGNTYTSIKAMCDFYNINKRTYDQRRKAGWTLKEALIGKSTEYVTDHLGNKYKSFNEMAKTYNIDTRTLHSRLYSGWSLEKALTTLAGDINYCCDHLGNQYMSIKEMCAFYGVKVGTYRSRRQRGYSIEDSLKRDNLPHKIKDFHKTEVCDHHGNRYPTIKEMCHAYNQSYSKYHRLIKMGCDLETALTSKDTNLTIYINGKKYHHLPHVCEELNLNINRIRNIMKTYHVDIEEAIKIHNAPPQIHGQECQDHLGNIYPSIRIMCQYYGIRPTSYYARIAKGWTIEKVLTTPQSDKMHGCEDHLGQKYNSIKALTEHYGISRARYKDLLKHGWNQKNILLYHDISLRPGNYKNIEHKYLGQANGQPYFECTCKICGLKNILTPNQMTEHSKLALEHRIYAYYKKAGLRCLDICF